MAKRPDHDLKLQARVKALRERAKLMANVKERPFMQVLERWLEPPKRQKDDANA